MPQGGNQSNSGRNPEDGQSPDFGDFVSRHIQRTSSAFRGGSKLNPEDRPDVSDMPTTPRAGGDRTIEQSRDRSYWRRRAAGAGAPVSDRAPADRDKPRVPSDFDDHADDDRYDDHYVHEDEWDADDSGGGAGGFGAFLSGDGDDGNRNRIVAALILVAVIALLIFGLTRLFGGDDKESDIPAVQSPTVVVEPSGTPGPDDQPPTPTPEPSIPRGGDNQRGEQGGDADSGRAQLPELELKDDAARACSGLCLVRMDGANQEEALANAGARASWADGDISWLVVSPQQAQRLSTTHALTFIENDPRTYNLYAVKADPNYNKPEVITPYGDIVDRNGIYYLVRWDSVPAIVRPVTDWGYFVYKLAPAQPQYLQKLGSKGSAQSVTGWNLIEQIDSDNIERIVREFSMIGELSNSGYGTRYYTYPGNQIAADYLYQELESYGLSVWYEDFIMWDGYLLVNVVAEIPGRDASEIYAIMAHLDSINNDNPRLASGADDNASGVAATLEAIRVLSAYELEHPVRVVFVNAEEVGIVGSDSWARAIVRNGVPIAGVFNVDSVGSVRNRPVMITNADADSAWMQRLLSRMNETYDLRETMEHKQNPAIVADDNRVRDQGIPAVMLARELFGLNPIHHTLNDTLENVSFGAIHDTANLMVVTLWELVK